MQLERIEFRGQAGYVLTWKYDNQDWRIFTSKNKDGWFWEVAGKEFDLNGEFCHDMDMVAEDAARAIRNFISHDLDEALLNAPIVFGLKAQGHLPKIQQMLSEMKSWEEIGNEIGWCPTTAREYYERQSWEEGSWQKEVLPTLAAAVGMLEELSKTHKNHVWDHNRVATILFNANKCLASKTQTDLGTPRR